MVVGVRPVRAQSTAEWHWRDILERLRVRVAEKASAGRDLARPVRRVVWWRCRVVAGVRRQDSARGPRRPRPAARRAGRRRGHRRVVAGLRPIQRHAGTWMFGGVAVFGVCIIVFGVSTSFWLSLAVLAIAGAGDMVSVFVRGMLVQLETPDAIRGRVSAVNSMFIGASNELGAFRAGSNGAGLGTVHAVVCGGVVTLVVVASYLKLFPQLRKLDRFPEPAQADLGFGATPHLLANGVRPRHPVLNARRHWIYGRSVYKYSSRMAGAIKGRGAFSQPPGRFDKLTKTLEHDGWYEEEAPNKLETIVLPEPARSIISRNKSPDIAFESSINPYRGCESWLHLLLRPPQPRLRRPFPGPRLRNQTLLQSQRRPTSRSRARCQKLQMLAHHARREHRPLPASRENTTR